MTRKLFIIASAFALSAGAQTPGSTWYDLTVHNAQFSGTNLVSGDIHPVGALPSMRDFNAARSEIAEAWQIATNSMGVALAASNAAARAAADIADATSNGIWEVVFTLSALRGVGAADDIESKTVGFSVEATPTNRLCHVVQWFADIPPSMPEFDCTYTTNLVTDFETISVTTSYPATVGAPEQYGQTGGACYRITIAVPLAWQNAFFKVLASGFVLRGNSLPVVGGVAGGAAYDITVLDAAGLTNVTLNVRGGFVVNTNSPISLMLYEAQNQ